ncbi:hypothetical protein D3C76_1653420 [compost metagenome]
MGFGDDRDPMCGEEVALLLHDIRAICGKERHFPCLEPSQPRHHSLNGGDGRNAGGRLDPAFQHTGTSEHACSGAVEGNQLDLGIGKQSGMVLDFAR